MIKSLTVMIKSLTVMIKSLRVRWRSRSGPIRVRVRVRVKSLAVRLGSERQVSLSRQGRFQEPRWEAKAEGIFPLG